MHDTRLKGRGEMVDPNAADRQEPDSMDPQLSADHAGPAAYQRVSPVERPRRKVGYGHALSLAVTPILGSRLCFPRLFDRAVERHLRDPAGAPALPLHYVRWYFGAHLTFPVDPARLKRRISDFVRDRGAPRWIGTSFLDGADWDEALAPISKSPIHREMMHLVRYKLDYRAIPSFAAVTRAAERGQPVSRNGIRLASPGQIEAYFRYCVDLVASVRENGVVPRHAFRRFERSWARHRQARPLKLDSTERDVGVAITPDGELIRHLGGKHRTAAAQALRLPTIPVELRLVHVGWLARESARTNLPAHQALRRFLERMHAGGGS